MNGETETTVAVEQETTAIDPNSMDAVNAKTLKKLLKTLKANRKTIRKTIEANLAKSCKASETMCSSMEAVNEAMDNVLDVLVSRDGRLDVPSPLGEVVHQYLDYIGDSLYYGRNSEQQLVMMWLAIEAVKKLLATVKEAQTQGETA